MEQTFKSHRPYELIHRLPYDVVVNTIHSNPSLRDYAYNAVKDGIPFDWLQSNVLEYLPWNARVDNVDNPNLFIKMKRHDLLSYRSILREFAFVPLIRQLTQSPDGQQIALSEGFDQLLVIEPLIGVINREERRKYMIYPFVHADTHVKSRNPNSNRFTMRSIHSITGRLQSLFYKHNIVPNDLTTMQVMGSGQEDPIPNTLFLFDIEGYRYKNTISSH